MRELRLRGSLARRTSCCGLSQSHSSLRTDGSDEALHDEECSHCPEPRLCALRRPDTCRCFSIRLERIIGCRHDLTLQA